MRDAAGLVGGIGGSRAVWVLVAAVVGMAAGVVARRGVAGRAESAAAVEGLAPAGGAATKAGDRGGSGGTGAAVGGSAKVGVGLRSDDTGEGLLALDGAELYERLGLWLVDAPVGEVARFWAAYQQRAEIDTWAMDLVFARWTRLDPLGAVRGAGEKGAGSAWWAWAINDPAAAVAKVTELAPDKAGFVMRAIGSFHPELAQQVLAEHPEFGESNAVEGIAEGLARDDPRAALEFLREHQRYDTEVMEEWVRDDPQAAFEWVSKQSRGFPSGHFIQTFIATLERENPEALAELAAAQPAGRLRREMEAALFRSVLDRDPEAALAQARASATPRLAGERLAEIGQRLVARDPQRAFAVYSEMLERCPDAMSRWQMIEYPNGSSGSGGAVAGVIDFTQQLVQADPRRMMELAVAAEPEVGNDHWESLFGRVSDTWARQDAAGFGEWVDAQEAGPHRDGAAGVLAAALGTQRRFDEAAEWVARVVDERQRERAIERLAQEWAGADRAAAAAWLGQVEVSDRLRKQLDAQLRAREEQGRQ